MRITSLSYPDKPLFWKSDISCTVFSADCLYLIRNNIIIGIIEDRMTIREHKEPSQSSDLIFNNPNIIECYRSQITKITLGFFINLSN